ncbi:OmpA family protein [Chryseolinea lacunae]|uniref:PD40 domain-containing protein n=1 Tax=Chryseolinea lacunae TaxID=2801331 RepID=A0ABS1KSB4_9BACT|nr:OmpA family protein [Chryseolinea lacunae]MBL0741186.1 PD40 domain-containing protein [Chryseolinea lacunae]
MCRGKYVFIVLVLLLGSATYAQDQKALIAAGDKYYGKKDYKNALASFLAAQEINPDDASLNFKIGLSYLYSETKSKAASYIDKAYRLNPAVNPDIDYHLGIAFQNTNDFQKAIEHFERFKKKKANLSSIVDEKIAECHIADSLSQNELNVIIQNLGPVVNTPFSDYSPIISADGNTLIFTSNRTDDPARAKAGQNFEDIYVTYKQGSDWSAPKLISPNVNIKYNDAAASLSPDGKTLFLYLEEGEGDIYTSTRTGDEWSKPEPLNKNINTGMFWETCASVTADGKKLYFASNRPGGIGELDLYVSELDGRGQWGKAVNLGPIINTPENEDSPFIHHDGVTLYFSSDGHPRLGNSDIFMAEFVNGKWKKPENMGYPLNSWEYDGFFTLSPDKKQGYFSTAKEGGLGDADIYSIKFLDPKYKPKPKPAVVAAAEKAAAEEKAAKTEIPKSEEFIDPSIAAKKAQKVVTLLKGKVIDESNASPLGAVISLVDNTTNKVITKINTNPLTGEFELVIPHGGNYGVATEKSGYLFNSINFALPEFAEYQEIDTHIIMVKAEVGSKVVLKNIFFDIGKSDLKTESVAEVENIRELMITNPNLKVQINGHTDNSGNAASNKALSLKRASSVVTYLASHGIDASRVSAKGYGSERPIVSNDDEQGGREINRRTEIEIIK